MLFFLIFKFLARDFNFLLRPNARDFPVTNSIIVIIIILFIWPPLPLTFFTHRGTRYRLSLICLLVELARKRERGRGG